MTYKIKHLKDNKDLDKLSTFFTSVFNSEIEGQLAKQTTLGMPGLNIDDWYIQECNNEIASALAKVKWDISIGNIQLNVWEQAIVGTGPKYRGQNLMRQLNNQLFKDAEEAEVDFIMIQGIPDFYNKFAYRYAIEFENHFNLPLDSISDVLDDSYTIKKGTIKDYPAYEKQDNLVHDRYFIKSRREKDVWSYQCSLSDDAAYSSEIWFVDEYFVKIYHYGFGEGLIVSEISEDIPYAHLLKMFSLLKTIAIEKKKPYIRFNIQQNSLPAKLVLKMGGKFDKTYGWQVRIINIVKFLKKIKPIIQERITSSKFNEETRVFSLLTSGKVLNIIIKNGIIDFIENGELKDDNLGVYLPKDCIEPLVLGFRSWKEIQFCRCDLYPFNPESEELIEILFPKKDSWINSIW